MKLRFFSHLFLALGILFAGAGLSHAQTTTAFTYQGDLKQNGAAANGPFDFQFALYTSSTGGTATATITNLNVAAANGLFTAVLDFGNAFDGAIYWLDIAVRPSGGNGAFTSLTSRQQLTPAPYATYATAAKTVNGVIANSNLPDVVTPGTGQSVTVNSKGLVTGATPLTLAMLPPLSGSNIIGINSLAYQSTNRPTFAGATNQGDFTIAPNANFGTGVNLNIPVQGAINWYDGNNGFFSIYGNEGHTSSPELQFGSVGSFSFTEGQNSLHNSMNHFGGSGPYHGFYFMQYDQYAAVDTPLGFSHPFGFCYQVWDNNQAIYHYSAFRFEASGTNDGQGNLLYYDHAARGAVGGFAGFNQDLEPYSHVAGGFGPSNMFWGSATFTNGLSRGLQTSAFSGTTYLVDFSLGAPGFQHLSLGDNVTFGITNLSYNNTVITKDLFLDTGFNTSVALNWPANWQCESPTGTGVFPTNLSAGNIMHVRLTAECSATTNIYAEILLSPSMRTPDTNAFQFWTAAGITDGALRVALNSFVTGLKANNLWAQWDCIYPLVGGTSASCSWNLINPNSYRLLWTTGSSTFDANGWTSDGVSSFGNTQMNPATAVSPKYTQNSATMLVYNRTPHPSVSGYFIGATDGARAGLLENSPTVLSGDGFNDHLGAGSVVLGVTDFAGILCISRTDSTTTSIIATGATGALTNLTASTGVPTGNIYIGGRDSEGFANPIAANFGLVMIGGGLTPAQYLTLTNLIAVFETTLNRQ